MPMILGRTNRAVPVEALSVDMSLTGVVGNFLEMSQVITGLIAAPLPELDLGLSGEVGGQALTATQVLTLNMSAGGSALETFNWRATRDQGIRMSGSALALLREGQLPTITVTAGGLSATYSAARTFRERRFSRRGNQTITDLTGSDRVQIPSEPLPELVPWEADRQKQTMEERRELQRAIARVPVDQRRAARRDPRRMAVDQVVMAALSTVPHRLLVAPPFPGYDFLADGVSYSTLGKTAQDVVADIWGRIGIRTGWVAGVLYVMPPGPAGDLILPVPSDAGAFTAELITLDAPVVEATGGTPADPEAGGDPTQSPDPEERDPDAAPLEFNKGVSPSPQVDSDAVAAKSVPLSWEPVDGASQYILERLEGTEKPGPYALWSRLAAVTAPLYTDTTTAPNTSYWYRLRVNATARAGTNQNTLWSPSEPTLVKTPLGELLPPSQPTDLDGYYRGTSAFGVRWRAPKADRLDDPERNHDAASEYELKLFAQSGTLLRTIKTSQTWLMVEGLSVGATYNVELLARNGAGDSEPVLQQVVLNNLPPLPVEKPSVQVNEFAGDYTREITLKIKHNPNGGATSYAVQVRESADGVSGPWVELATLPVPKEPILKVKDLNAVNEIVTYQVLEKFGTRYELRVRAANAAGASAWSELATVTTDEQEPSAEPDPLAAGFESAASGTKQKTVKEGELEVTTIEWKRGGRLEGVRVIKVAKVPVHIRGGKVVGTDTKTIKISDAMTRFHYELPGWPLTLTASVTETLLFSPVTGRMEGREQEKTRQVWSPQGWLEQRITSKSRAGATIEIVNSRGVTIAMNSVEEREQRTETWAPSGDGQWLYTLDHTATILTPTYLIKGNAGMGSWSDPQTTTRVIASEHAVSSDAPPQATLPRSIKKLLKLTGEPVPELPKNDGDDDSPALSSYPLGGDDWFGDRPDVLPGQTPPAPPAGPADQPEVPSGTGDTRGYPAPDPIPADPDAEPVQETYTRPGTTPGANPTVISLDLPWVTTRSGLRKYAEYASQQGGERWKISRTYRLPYPAPSLALVESVDVSGRYGEFKMTIVTESRTAPVDLELS